jgi:hypothetical protein
MPTTSNGAPSAEALKGAIEKLCDAFEKLSVQVQKSPEQTATLEPIRKLVREARAQVQR